VADDPGRARLGLPSTVAGRDGVTLVFFPGALGDFVCLLPTLAHLRRRHPGRRLVAIVQEPLRTLAVRPGLADAALPIEGAAIARLFVPGADAGAVLGGERVAHVYSWFAAGDPVVRANLTRLAEERAQVMPFAPPPGWPRHVAWHFLATVGATPGGTRLDAAGIEPTAAEAAWAEAFYRAHRLVGRPVLGMHRGAGSLRKRWTDAGYADVGQWWRDRGGAVLEFSGPADAPDPLSSAHALARDLPLGEVAALLARVDLVLGADSGVSHLAGAVGATGVVIFGPTETRRWRPLGGRLVCLTANPVAPPADGPIPLSAMSTARVVRALRLLAAARSP
jgi:ADP-heptose:LPS heptosyltransferase